MIPRGNRFVPYLWARADEGDLSRFESQLADDYRVDRIVTVEESDDDRLYRVEWATELNGLFAGFRTHELSIEYASGTADRWEFRVFNRRHENLEAFQEYCVDHDIPIQVERVYHPTPPGEPQDWGLTPEQREAIVTAADLGYYHVPQETSLSDLGEALGISRQAASARLHRGLENLVSQTLLVDDDVEDDS